MLKILQARLHQYMNQEILEVQSGFRKGRGRRGQIANIRWTMEWKVKSLSRVRLFVTTWTVQALPSMGFSRQEYWSGLPFPSSGRLPNPGIKPGSLHSRQMLYHLSLPKYSNKTIEWLCLCLVGFFKVMVRWRMGLPRWLRGKESSWHRFNPWLGKIPWRRKWKLTPVFLPEKYRGQRSLVGYSPWGRKESDTTDWHSWATEHTHTLKPGQNAPGESPWAEEPGGLQSVHGVAKSRTWLSD